MPGADAGMCCAVLVLCKQQRRLLQTCAASEAGSCDAEQAVYDKASDSFVINTPDDTASKFWIGGAAQHGKVTPAPRLMPCFSCLEHKLSRSSGKRRGGFGAEEETAQPG